MGPSRYRLDEDRLVITAEIPLSHGTLRKHITVHRKEESLHLGYSFPDWDPPLSVIRTATVTLNPEFYDSDLQISCHNGGEAMETFDIDRNCDHTRAGSTLVSCNSGFGATGGVALLGDGRKGLDIRLEPSCCAAMPMLFHVETGSGRSLTRLFFSLRELDESSREGGHLPNFQVGLRPYAR
ncbi:MAG: hypothetical protein U5K31_02505 [Balneolaceae bacterium]|nr:hypothetical protein [Balneolaceae bacterium]